MKKNCVLFDFWDCVFLNLFILFIYLFILNIFFGEWDFSFFFNF
jgi:hypothetical protein